MTANNDGKHGAIYGGPFDGDIELDPKLLETGFVRGFEMKWHEYAVYTRPEGTKFFMYSGKREQLNQCVKKRSIAPFGGGKSRT